MERKKGMISDERIEELRKYFWNETDEEEEEIWRFELTEEEQKFVESLEEEYAKVFWELMNKISEHSNERE